MGLFDIKVLRQKSARLSVLALYLVLLSGVTHANPPSPELTKILPPDIGSFHQASAVRPLTVLAREAILRPEYFPPSPDPKAPPLFVGAEAEYLSKTGDKFLVEVVRFQTDSEAFSLLTLAGRSANNGTQTREIKLAEIGTASVSDSNSISFFRGTTFARVTTEAGNAKADELARSLAATFEPGEDDVPVLVKHLPDWLNVKARALYLMGPAALREAIANQPVLEAITFEGGTEAVVAPYAQSQLLIVEFTTPQFSIDNDQRIWTRINELKTKGQPVPSAYRRVGNYSVFVFNAVDEKTANALVDQVKYEQIVQWLGDDPHLYQRLQKYFTQTSAGVLVAVLKSSGLSLLFCLAAGALIGTMLFRHRRAQRAAAYSDAGGSVRLNLDDLTGPVKSRNLLAAKRPEHESQK